MRSLAGKLVYRLYHAPANRVMDSLRAGGPFEQRRTALGREAMRNAAFSLPLLPAPDSTPPLELHLLTGARFWEQTAFCLWSFAFHAQRTLAPVIYDDGTLGEAHREPLVRLFPLARFVTQAETLVRLDTLLPPSHFPSLRERWVNYPNIRKLTDIHVGQSGWKLVIDSDLLFFRKPTLLLSWLDQPEQPLHAVDIETSYGYTRGLMNQLAGSPTADLVNVGLCGLNSSDLDWDKIEYWCRTLIAAERTNYYLEQALVAMLVAGRACTVAPANDYVTLPRKPEVEACRAVMHHYVAGSKRWYFQDNWKKITSTAR